MSNIVLIGMPACGKSTVGVILAKTVGKNFIDTDLLIQEKEGALLQEIINEKGNDYFKNMEQTILSNLQAQNAVISTGGSAVYYEEAMEHLRKSGKIIYLKLPLSVIESRLDNIGTRGITMAKGDTLESLYQRRAALYEKEADVVLESEGMTVEETVEEILRHL